MSHPPRTNHIFVDYENVQDIDLDRIENKPVKVTLVLGEMHKKLPTALVKDICRFAGQVGLVETGARGPNALDLVLAFCVGEARNLDPAGYFHIVSRDKGFDALITHLKNGKTLAARHDAFDTIPVLMKLAERVKSFTDHARENPDHRARKKEALVSNMQAAFGRALSESEVDATIRALVSGKLIAISKTGEVTYTL